MAGQDHAVPREVRRTCIASVRTARVPRRKTAASGERGFLDQLRRFRHDGQPTRESEQGGIRYFTNAFWTARQRDAHSLHEISYRACFKPQLPNFFIERLTTPGEGVYDPFAGRGTTPVQAAPDRPTPAGQ